MDDSRVDDPVLERAGRRRLLTAAAAVAVLALGVLGVMLAAPGDGDDGPAPWIEGERVVVEVLNGSGRTGLARQVTRRLRTRSLDVIYFGNAAGPSDSTLVLVRRGPLAQGHEAARALGQGVVRLEPDSLRRVDVTILLGRDYSAPAGGPPL